MEPMTINQKQNEAVAALAREAMKTGRRIHITYVDATGAVTRRRVQVGYVGLNYFSGSCKRGFRSFVFDRVEIAKLQSTKGQTR